MPRKPSENDTAEKPSTKGRPRKTHADVEAVERRRTQLRVAQRAFRQRREATLDELRSEVSSLQDRHDDLLASVRGFAQRAVERGLADDLAVDLLAILKQHTETRSEDQGDETSASPTTAAADVPSHRRILRNLNSESRTPTDEYTDSSIEEIIREPTQDDSTEFTVPPQQPHVLALQHSSQHNVQSRYTNTYMDSFLPTLPHELSPLATLGVDDLSFGMRLRRRVLEAAYQLASNRWQAPIAFQRAFGRRIRTRGDNEAAIIHFLHDRLMVPPQQTQQYMRKNINWSEIRDPEDSPVLRDTFFFPADVETYLARKGIEIENGAWFVSTKMKRKLLRSIAPTSPLACLEPYFADLLQKHAGPAYQHATETTSPMSMSVTPSTSAVGANIYTNSNISQQYPPATSSWSDPAMFQIQNFDHYAEDMLPHLDRSLLQYTEPESTSHPFLDTSALSHEEAYFLEHQLLPTQSKNSYARYNTFPDFFETVTSSTPSLYTGQTISDQSDSEDALVDVTLDIMQLIQNLLRSVECLGEVQGIMKADVDRALMASVLLRT